jgi:hypothetical protein
MKSRTTVTSHTAPMELPRVNGRAQQPFHAAAWLLGLVLALGASSAHAHDNDRDGDEGERVTSNTLVGFTALPADTFAAGPPAGGNDGTGNPVTANGRTGPFAGQPVQGLSGVQFSDTPETFWFLADNGFGAKANSSDFLLRIYRLRTRFSGETRRSGVQVESFLQLSDPAGRIGFPIVNQATPERLLTGSDFDIESFVFDARGDLWVGDEFGPFLLHFDRFGRLLEAPIPTPDLDAARALVSDRFVRSPDNPTLGTATPNLGGSRGFEGMAFSVDRGTLYPLLEGTVTGDPANSLRIYSYQLRSKKWGFVGFYPTTDGHSIGDFTPVNDHQFLVIERDGGQGATALFKKVFLIDLRQQDSQGFLTKTELVDLLAIQDPRDLNRDGNTTFTFPFTTIEDVLVLDRFTILLANDNNYPFSLGRGPDIDNNEIIKIRLPRPLAFDPRLVRTRKSSWLRHSGW